MKATWHKAARAPIDVASHKTIVGVGSSGAIKGKGLRFRGGTTNVIVQNIAVTDLNPEFVWGGDAISFDGSDLIWIDHVTVSLAHKLHIINMAVTKSYGHPETSLTIIADSSHWPPALRLRLQPQQAHHPIQQPH